MISSSVEHYRNLILSIINSNFENHIKKNLLRIIKSELDSINCGKTNVKCLYGRKILNVPFGINVVKVVCNGSGEILTGFRNVERSKNNFDECPYVKMSNECSGLIRNL